LFNEKENKKENKKERTRATIKKMPKISTHENSPPLIKTGPVLNEKLADLMGELSELMAKKGDQIRSRVYKRAQESIMAYTEDITDIRQLRGNPGIGPTIMEKCKEYIETGKLELLEREKNKPEYLLSNVYGIGPIKARELVDKENIKTIQDLRDKQESVLNVVQKIGLQYYEDIQERIPRKEIDEYNEVFKNTMKLVGDIHSTYEIVGSYRRGKSESGDIDVIITSDDPAVFEKFVNQLLEDRVITNVLSRGKTKSLVVSKIPSSKFHRRLDLLYTRPLEYPFAVLYFTGSKGFNTVMRGHALKNGFSLNEHGLSKMVDKKKTELVDHIFTNERDIFDYLKLEYKEPNERVDGRAVVPVKGSVQMEPLNGLETISPKVNITKKKRESKEPKPPKEPKVPKPPKEPKPKKSPKKKEPKEPKTRKVRVPKQKPIKIKEEIENIKNILDEFPKEESMIQKTPEKESFLEPASQLDIPKNEIIIIKKNKTKKNKESGEKKSPKSPKTKKNREKKQNEKDINISKVVTIEDIPKEDMEKTKKHIHDFKEIGISILDSLNEKQLSEMIVLASNAYYNEKNILMTDNEYDIVKEYIERKFPKNEAVEQVGAPVKKNKVTLPFEMPSMDKIKPDSNALTAWTTKYKGPYVLSCKLDGVSGMYSTVNDEPKLYTRGDGKIGQDISHLIPILNLPKEKGCVVRGEFIIPKQVFEEKYKSSFANPRNLVSGIINSKSVDEKAKDLHFVTYEIIQPVMKPSEQLAKLVELKHEVVMNNTLNTVSNESLSQILVDWRTNYKYEIDGVIVTNDEIYERISGNPDHAFAFKMVLLDQMAEAKVVDVIWEASKSGYLKPRVRIEPIRLGGVTIEYATGFNGKFIEDNKIGIGALIQMIRSGDVIPYIKSVTMPAEKAKMPSVPYVWTDTHVDVVLEDIKGDVTVLEKNITQFFVELGVDGLSGGNVKRIMKAGFNSVGKILKMSKADFEKVEGFKTKMIDKIYDGIHEKVGKASLLDIMAASNTLGRGLGMRKLKPMMDAFPDILTSSDPDDVKVAKLKSIHGIGAENAKSFVSNIPVFLEFLRECGLEGKLNGPVQLENAVVQPVHLDQSHPLFGKKIVMTKVRDKEIIEKLGQLGATLEDSVNKTTFALIVKSKEDESNKTKKAKDLGIPIYMPEEFKAAFFL